MNKNRKLATIQTVGEVNQIDGADSIEYLKILGWKVISKKGDLKQGDKCVFFEVGSFLPVEPQYEFLRKSSYKDNTFMGKSGFRIKTMKIMKQLSQGLALPFTSFDKSVQQELNKLDVGSDVSELLNVSMWEQEAVAGDLGTTISEKPYGIPTTNELRVQTYPELHEKLLGKPFYITTKIDGSSMSIFKCGDDVGVCSHNKLLDLNYSGSMVNYFHNRGFKELLEKLNKNIVIQGEFAGPKIQENKLQLKDYDFFVFDVMDLDTHEYYTLSQMQALLPHLGLKSVPLEYCGVSFNYTQNKLLELAQGQYAGGKPKEGIVVRSNELIDGERISFKVLNNVALLKEH